MYPLTHHQWIKAEAVVADHFTSLIKSKWSENIAKVIWDFVGDDFTMDQAVSMTEENIDENLIRLFH